MCSLLVNAKASFHVYENIALYVATTQNDVATINALLATGAAALEEWGRLGH
jgi:hypothetical protein